MIGQASGKRPATPGTGKEPRVVHTGEQGRNPLHAGNETETRKTEQAPHRTRETGQNGKRGRNPLHAGNVTETLETGQEPAACGKRDRNTGNRTGPHRTRETVRGPVAHGKRDRNTENRTGPPSHTGNGAGMSTAPPCIRVKISFFSLLRRKRFHPVIYYGIS